jgi:transposase
MANYKEIIRLHESGSSQRDIAAIEHCSLRAVSETLKVAKSRQVGYAQLTDMDDVTIRQLLFDPPERINLYYQPDFAKIAEELKISGVNLSLLWDEYVRKCQAADLKAYQYSQFANLYSQWRREHGKNIAATKRVKHVAGRLLEVDWAGDRSAYIDIGSGEIIEPYVFVACLPYSQRIYSEAFDDMKQESWNTAHIHTFAYNKGVSELITPDNCKTGVNKPDYYDPVINKDYSELANHYGVSILPARPRSPKDKSSTENSVKFVETWVIAYLREQKFFSLAELNAAIFKRVDAINTQNFKGLDYSRNDVFMTEELPCLSPLPDKDYEKSQWRVSKVGMDYCIQIERQRYSVPYRLVGQHVDVRFTDSTIEIFKNGERICSHLRLRGRFNQCSVKEEHMPEEHKLYAEEWNPERFKKWAASIGPSCLVVIESILVSKPHPALTYRSCMGVLSYARSKGNTFLEEICKRACDTSRKPNYGQIKMLAKNAEKKAAAAKPIQVDEYQSIGDTGMVRGSDYYRLD